MGIKKTGGGPETIITDVSTDSVSDIMNPKTVYGLPNTFDSDYLPSSSHFSDHSYTDGTISVKSAEETYLSHLSINGRKEGDQISNNRIQANYQRSI
ncbi:hypothetical protein JTB14_031605 [Gonioctena quinquepunctata]|nr:hypothetical protein JTB14_031605 [Gonioctena quinquepunctata]